ncbi:MAG: DUF1015 domain-containing protein, partial [Planctomycetota bacterium]|nr:DUF1015 domain-containing protein [Planctomycetota bacterium]
MVIRPFRALRCTPDSAATVASVPYDVVDTTEARRLAEGNPTSFLHVVRSEIDLPKGTDPYSDAVYEKAGENLQMLISSGHMVREDGPSLYAYRMTVDGQAQVGLLAGSSIDEYESGLIKKHELTRRDKEDDRTRHMLALGAQPGPVLVAYKDAPAIDELLAGVVEAASPIPQHAKRFCAYLGGRWYELAIKPQFADEGDAVKSLDCSILHEHIMEPILGVRDIRTDPRIKFVG